jgi:Tfp pilus assembly protein PilN
MNSGNTSNHFMGASLGIVLAVLLTSACSRQEKPVAPAATKAKGVESAPAVERHEQPIAFTNKAPAAALSEHKGSGRRVLTEKEQDASRAAMMKRQKAYAEKVIGDRLVATEIALTQEQQELDCKEVEIREKDPILKAAFEEVLSARRQYEAACAEGIPCYAGLTTETATLKKRVDDYVALRNQGQLVDLAALAAEHKKLNTLLRNIRESQFAANATNATVRTAFEHAIKTQEAYASALGMNRDYEAAKARTEPTAARVEELKSTQEKLRQ